MESPISAWGRIRDGLGFKDLSLPVDVAGVPRSYGYPWFGRTYNLALEIVSGPPDKGIGSGVEDQTALVLPPGEIISTFANAIVYTGSGRLAKLHEDGKAEWKTQA
jgi:hypothetical protein